MSNKSRGPTRRTAYQSIANNLIDFGYAGVTADMIADTHAAMKDGKKGKELPHGIIGMMAESQLAEHADKINSLPEG